MRAEVRKVETPATCPRCEGLFETTLRLGSTGALGPGDRLICAYCGSWLVLDDDGRFRLASTEEFEEIRAVPEAHFAECAVLEFQFKKGSG